MRGLMMDFPLTLVHVLERAGKLFGDVEIVSRRPDRRLRSCTYRDVYLRARSLARALQLAGMKPGDRVATLLWNHSTNLECYFGIPVAGGVMHTLNLRLHPDELAYIANHAQDRFLIVDDILLPTYESFRAKVPFERVICVPFAGADARRDWRTTNSSSNAPMANSPIPKLMKIRPLQCASPPAPPASRRE